MLNNKLNAPRFPWCEKDEKYLLDNYHLKPVNDICLVLDKTAQSVTFKAKRMGIANAYIQRLLREGRAEKALDIYNKTGQYCHFLTKRFGNEKPGYQSRHFGI
jgi:hypothetical protein